MERSWMACTDDNQFFPVSSSASDTRCDLPSYHRLLIPFYLLFRARPRWRVGGHRLFDPWQVREHLRAIAVSEVARLPARRFSANLVSAIRAPAELQALV